MRLYRTKRLTNSALHSVNLVARTFAHSTYPKAFYVPAVNAFRAIDLGVVCCAEKLHTAPVGNFRRTHIALFSADVQTGFCQIDIPEEIYQKLPDGFASESPGLLHFRCSSGHLEMVSTEPFCRSLELILRLGTVASLCSACLSAGETALLRPQCTVTADNDPTNVCIQSVGQQPEHGIVIACADHWQKAAEEFAERE